MRLKRFRRWVAQTFHYETPIYERGPMPLRIAIPGIHLMGHYEATIELIMKERFKTRRHRFEQWCLKALDKK